MNTFNLLCFIVITVRLPGSQRINPLNTAWRFHIQLSACSCMISDRDLLNSFSMKMLEIGDARRYCTDATYPPERKPVVRHTDTKGCLLKHIDLIQSQYSSCQRGIHNMSEKAPPTQTCVGTSGGRFWRGSILLDQREKVNVLSTPAAGERSARS